MIRSTEEQSATVGQSEIKEEILELEKRNIVGGWVVTRPTEEKLHMR